NASPVSRTLATLAEGGLMTHVEETGRYRLGSRLMVYGHLVHSRLDLRQSRRALLAIPARGPPPTPHATAAGKVGLAFGPPELPPGRLRRFTERTVTDRARLEGELDDVRRQGFATARGEREPDLNAIAAPVFALGGGLAAIVGVQGPSSRFDPETMTKAAHRLRSISLA